MIKYRPSRDAKHIDIRTCFIMDNQLKGLLEVEYVPANEQKADHLTKPMKPAAARKAIKEIVWAKGECYE